MSMRAPLSYAAAIARTQTIGTLLGVAVERLLEAVGDLEDGRERRLRVWVSDGFDRLSVLAAAPTASRHASLLAAAGGDALVASAIPVLGQRPGQLFVELEAGGGPELAIEIQGLGRGSIDDDLRLLRSMAPVGDAAHTALARLAAELATGGRSAGIAVRFEPPGTRQWMLHVSLAASVELAAAALSRVAAAAGITPAQRNLLAVLHPLLGEHSPAVATLRIGPGVVYPELTVTYHDVAFEPVIRILIGIHPGVDHASRLGAVAGACNAERAAALAIQLRDREPLGLRVAFDLDQDE